MKKFGLIISVISFLISCESGDHKKILKESNGRINSLVIVMKNSDWRTELGDELRNIVAEPVLGLPEPEESIFDISQVPIKSFGSMFKASRNVLILDVGEENSIKMASNVYAAPQKIITITGKSKEDLIDEINKNGKRIVSEFKNADLKAVQKRLLAKIWDPVNIETFSKQGFSFKIPKTFSKVEDNGDFLWYRHHLRGGNSLELIAYTIPITSEDDENGNNIVLHRNSIGEKYIPGHLEGSHMITEEAYTPHIFQITFKEKKAFETRGKWEVKKAFMAGPFLSYSVVDKANNRIVVVEGLTYAPSIDKRDYMFELEAVLKTLTVE